MMKKYLLFPVTLVAMLTMSEATFAQPNVDDATLKHSSKSGIKMTLGGRLFADAAYYNSTYTTMKSGASIASARINGSLMYNDFLFYADFDFAGGKVSQKNIFGRYNFGMSGDRTHSVKFGYYNESASMSRNTSSANYNFISRPSASIALSSGRALGVSYKFYNDKFFLDQGVFAENKYNDQIDGNQGATVSGRWLFKPINNDEMILQVGTGLTYAVMNTGTVKDNVLVRHMALTSSLQTYVDPTYKFLNADVAWAKNALTVNPEVLFIMPKLFVRGEYIYKTIGKDRPDQRLFENQLGGEASWASLASWQKGNPIRTSNFSGGYIEGGVVLFGGKYTYNREYGLLNGMKCDNTLEFVFRYNYTNLNDITEGDVFLVGKKRFYPNGNIIDYPAQSTSIGGGELHAVTLGLNYTVNKFFKVMADYQYNRISNVYFPEDKNINMLQMRLMFTF